MSWLNIGARPEWDGCIEGESIPDSTHTDGGTRIAQDSTGTGQSRDALALLHEAVVNLPIEVALFDGDDRLQLASRGLAQRCGVVASELIGASSRSIAKLLAESVSVIDDIDGVHAGEVVEELTKLILGADPGVRELRFHNGDRRGISSHPVGVHGRLVLCTDIGEIKEVEEGVPGSTDMARRIVEACPLPLAMIRLSDNKVLYESPSNNALFCETEDTKAERVGGYDVDPSQRVEYMKRLRRDGFVNNFEIRFRRLDGTEFTGGLSGRIIDFAGEPVIVSGVVDLTEQIEREATLRRILDVSPTPITMYRVADAKVTYENPAAQALFGSRLEPQGEGARSRWVDDAERERTLQQILQRQAVDGLEVQLRRADGSSFWAAFSARLIAYQGEEVIITSIYDLTERREAEAELARQREKLHQSEKLSALGEVLASVSHELNNPLSVLVGQSQLLRETVTEPDLLTKVERISQAADRCARIVKTFLAMARERPTEVVEVAVSDVVSTSLELTAYALRTAGIQVQVEHGEHLPPVMGDADQLSQVVTNLVVNAQQALEGIDGRRELVVRTGYRQLDDRVTIEVADNGPGIPEKIRSRIFEPLFTTKEVGAGTGIGLALCHRIAEAHGGSLEVKEGTPRGTAIVLALPPARPRVSQQGEGEGVGVQGPPLQVLVVDDEADVGDLIQDILIQAGHGVELVRSGEAAVEALQTGAYDVVLSDVRMPGTDGPALFRFLSEERPELVPRVAFITGDALSAKVAEFLETSGCPHLEKPFTPVDVRRLIERVRESGRGGRDT